MVETLRFGWRLTDGGIGTVVGSASCQTLREEYERVSWNAARM